MKTKQILDSANIRTTPARQAILDILQRQKKPVDVVFLLEELEKRSISVNRATVFRIMNLFTQEGLTHQIELGEGKYRYELTTRPHHHHVVCTKCGAVSDIEDCDTHMIEKKIQTQLSFHIQTHRLEFFGLCAACQ